MSIDQEQYVWPTSFVCTLITDKIILPNQYSINVGIEPVNPSDVNLGFRRLKAFVDNFLHNSIFISQDHLLLKPLETVSTNIVVFPTEPYDYFAGTVLFRKFESITANYFDIGFITIDSAIGDHIQYCIKSSDESELDLTGEHWWNMDNIDTGIGNKLSWTDLDIHDSPKFEPKVIKGGLSED